MTPKPAPPDQIKTIDPDLVAIPEYWGSVSKPPSFLGFMRKRASRLFEPKPRELWRPQLVVA